MADSVSAPPRVAIRAQRRFAAPREKVFRAWTEPDALKRWWCPPGWTAADIEVDLRVGGAYRIGMRRIADNTQVYVYGTFLEVRWPEQLVYTWRWDGAFEALPETKVTVEFLDVKGSTKLVLTHESFPELAVRQQHLVGWVTACDRMERIL